MKHLGGSAWQTAYFDKAFLEKKIESGTPRGTPIANRPQREVPR
jgi:hypothetical protein